MNSILIVAFVMATPTATKFIVSTSYRRCQVKSEDDISLIDPWPFYSDFDTGPATGKFDKSELRITVEEAFLIVFGGYKIPQSNK